MTLLAFLLAMSWRPEPVTERGLPWLALAAFYAGLLAFLGEVMAG